MINTSAALIKTHAVSPVSIAAVVSSAAKATDAIIAMNIAVIDNIDANFFINYTLSSSQNKPKIYNNC